MQKKWKLQKNPQNSKKFTHECSVIQACWEFLKNSNAKTHELL
jgi:hypothetical protein